MPDDRTLVDRARFWLGVAEKSCEGGNFDKAAAVAGLARAYAAVRAVVPAVEVRPELAYDLVDRDGDRWSWSQRVGAWGMFMGATPVHRTREAVEAKFGPVREVLR